MTMVMTTIHKSSFEGEVDQWLTMVDRIIVYKVKKYFKKLVIPIWIWQLEST